jgi:hypothetical protein
MTDKLKELIDRAQSVPMSEDDKEAQRRSFAYGNAHIENQRITKQMVEDAAQRIAKPE